MKKLCRKDKLKASPRLLFNFGNQPKKTLHEKNVLEIRYFETGSSKT